MYSNQLISSVLDIPSRLATFAGSLGLDVDSSNPDQPIINAPSPTGAIQFRVRASAVSLVHQLIIEPVSAPEVTSYAFAQSPIIDGVTVDPVSVSFIGGLLPEPFLGTVIHYGDNHFRHLYYGHLEKLGNYDGGEVIAAVNGPVATSGSPQDYRRGCQYLGQALQSIAASDRCGGARIVHADSSTDWRVFKGPSSPLSALSGWTQSQICGGFGDDVNDGYLARGRSPFSGVTPLNPINLYAPIPLVGDTSFKPVGNLAGVRTVNMQDIPVGAQIEIAGEFWRCFPAISRSFETTLPVGAGNWRASETSYMVGYAYFEG